MRKIFLITLILVLLLALGLPWVVQKIMEPRVQEEGTIVRLYRHDADTVELMSLEDYVTGVVAAEMPALFPDEALKAQAVAARTYIVKRMVAGGVMNNCHEGADTCDNPSHAQGCLTRAEMKERWGTLKYYQYYYKIRMAVDDTAGEIITYQGQPIDPVFHAACGGHTEDAEDVWMYSVPYLRGVACPYENNPNSIQQVAIGQDQVAKALGVELQSVPVSTKQDQPIKVVESTSTGRPKTLLINDRRLSASEIRQKLGLRSTNFTWQFKNDQIIFETVGYGHGVGMCQYGASGLAEHGYDYKQIINHYYTGVQINNINDYR
ncbi:stage II sporulation protein D [Desulfoscipio gibsoniae]|uniref:Stage II sporulation protein D n=1 Tax=Desulfoscipio gibsoniae DSM 7213 TaxID=767817 RepID=R4KW12_9FIRM|nr:stage II sporulation protein D [Desulfoscipio gibsoniae]AGL03811.1 stage II sporulation protein D [Desulfoscipio gibsoniae DSM 7213]